MGTRHLTVIITDGETRVSQYGQWDGYPSSAAASILAAINSTTLAELKRKALTCVSLTDEQVTEMWTAVGADDSGYATMDVSDKFKEAHPSLTRDTGYGIVQLIIDSDDGLEVYLNTNFGNDSLFCEWAYVIDFDKNTFEVYKGGFSNKVTKSYPLDNLPDLQEVLDDCGD